MDSASTVWKPLSKFFLEHRQDLQQQSPARVKNGSGDSGTSGHICLSDSSLAFFNDAGRCLLFVEAADISVHQTNARNPNSHTPLLRVLRHGEEDARAPLFEFLCHASDPVSVEKAWGARERAKDLISGMISKIRVNIESLKRDPSVQLLYDKLVVKKSILTEAEFWQQRKEALAQEQLKTQRSGFATAFLDKRPQSLVGQAVERHLAIQEQTTELIFATHPRVKTLFDRLVPRLMNNLEFWQRYFQAEEYVKEEAEASLTTVSRAPEEKLAEFMHLHRAADRHIKERSFIKRKVSRFVDPLVDLSANDDGVLDQQHCSYGVGHTAFTGASAVPDKQALALFRNLNTHSSVVVGAAAGGAAAIVAESADREDIDGVRSSIAMEPSSITHSRRNNSIIDLLDEPVERAVPLMLENATNYFPTIPKATGTQLVASSESCYDALAAERALALELTPVVVDLNFVPCANQDQLMRTLTERSQGMGEKEDTRAEGIVQASALLLDVNRNAVELLRHFWSCVDDPSQQARAQKLFSHIQQIREHLQTTVRAAVQPQEQAACEGLARTLERAEKKFMRAQATTRKRKGPPLKRKV